MRFRNIPARMEEVMDFHARVVLVLLAAATPVAHPVPASAADNARYISINGNNDNNCSLTAPCRTLQRGIKMTPAGGELRILDSGSYGGATINRSMTLSGNGNTVFLDSPLTINSAEAVVALRGLVLNGQGTATSGILISEAATVHVERCVIHGFAQHGINALATGIELFVLDTISRDNGFDGLRIAGFSTSRLTVDNSRFDGNGNSGIGITAGRGTISRSTASRNASSGIFAEGAGVSIIATVSAHNGNHGFFASLNSSVIVESSLAQANGMAGVFVGSATARISNSTFTSNSTGVHNNGTLETRQNNTVRGNTTNVAGNNALTNIGGI
jgi:hypothetical protein